MSNACYELKFIPSRALYQLIISEKYLLWIEPVTFWDNKLRGITKAVAILQRSDLAEVLHAALRSGSRNRM